MSNTFLLPDLGEGLTEADIVRWLVAEGDTVAVDQPMVEVETAKALVEVPSPYAGTVLTLHGAEGETMDVGSPLITIGEAGESGEGSAPVAGTETLAVPPSTGAAAAEAARPASSLTCEALAMACSSAARAAASATLARSAWMRFWASMASVVDFSVWV